MGRELLLHETQEISINILKRVADICEKNDLRYYLIYGTLIGAIRHKGFIPWDDDLDIMMPRDDYEKLLKYFRENKEQNPDLEVFEPRMNKEYPYMIARVSDKSTYIQTHNEKDCGMGVFIDIYPFDGLGDTREEAIKFGLKGDFLSTLCYQSTRQTFEVGITKGSIKKIIKYPIYIISKLLGSTYWKNRLLKLQGQKKYDASKYVGCIVWLSGGEKDIFEREWFGKGVALPFGEYEFRVPDQYDKILRHIYGDYMQLPPESDRIGHHNYKVYYKE